MNVLGSIASNCIDIQRLVLKKAVFFSVLVIKLNMGLHMVLFCHKKDALLGF